jgi:hypothetical protein
MSVVANEVVHELPRQYQVISANLTYRPVRVSLKPHAALGRCGAVSLRRET